MKKEKMTIREATVVTGEIDEWYITQFARRVVVYEKIIQKFFQDPKNCREFEEWKKKKALGQTSQTRTIQDIEKEFNCKISIVNDEEYYKKEK